MSANVATTSRNKQTVLRDKRAQGIAAMGLVTRDGDRFRVATPSLRGRKVSYEVWRDAEGKVRCSCLEYEEQAATDAMFRCEHILAVKHSLTAKNTEAGARPQLPASKQVANEAAETASMTKPTKDENASEKRATKKAPRFAVQPAVARFERESNETNESTEAVAAEDSTIRPLAKHNKIEEQMMIKQKEEKVITHAPEQEIEREDEMTLTNEAIASVVPLAFANTLRALKQPVDQRFVKAREGWTDRQGNMHMVEYVEWHTVADILDRVAPTWSHAVRDVKQVGDIVAVTAAITIDGVTREGVGTGTAESEMGIKKAEHDALKRAAVKFGIARELYQRESEVIEKQGAAPQAGQFPRDPLAKSMSDLVTPKQLGMIRALAREAGVDVDEECQSVLECKADELSKRAASSFIDHLKGLNQEAAAAGNQMRRAS
jgi:hypothetical protein